MLVRNIVSKFSVVGALILVSLGSMAATSVAYANSKSILHQVAVAKEGRHLKIQMRLQGKPEVRYFGLEKSAKKPYRLVVDLKQTRKPHKLKLDNASKATVSAIRTGWPKPDTLRVVFEMPRAVKLEPVWRSSDGVLYSLDWLTPVQAKLAKAEIKKQKALSASGKAKPARIKPKSVKPIHPALAPKSLAKKSAKAQPVKVAHTPKAKVGKPLLVSQTRSYKQAKKSQRLRPIVVAIDAGHGGNDPGARGPQGTQEKHVSLAIAMQLKRVLSKDKRYKPVMVRSSDRYLRLRQRTAVARNYKADVFVSIHADAFTSSKVRGASVYALSTRGASSEHARWLAQKQNAADLVGGVSLGDKENHLASMLLDLTQTATLEDSLGAGRLVLAELSKVTKLHKKRVHQAGFMVLKSPDIPSMLIEVGYISNPTDEQLLIDKAHQRRLANSIATGLKKYFEANPPAGATDEVVAGNIKQHKVKRGDTLSEIAEAYGISQSKLRRANGIKSANIYLGQMLDIPY